MQVQDQLVGPAVEGTENVLGSVNRCPSVQRVVLTSSIAALYGDPWDKGKDHLYSELVRGGGLGARGMSLSLTQRPPSDLASLPNTAACTCL